MIRKFRELLKELYSEEELSQVIFLVFEHLAGFSKTDLVMKRDETIPGNQQELFEQVLSELKTGRPVQYALGFAWFNGMKFMVNENVLIPRQETEELVDWIVRDSESDIRKFPFDVLDVCTGSGCIAISLKKKFPDAKVTALDVSPGALALAKENSLLNQSEVQFIEEDVLRRTSHISNLESSFNIIVSNPPYVLTSEKEKMNSRVLDFEPHLALFVEDTNPLIFYDAIAELALKMLKPGGRLYFEINEAKGKAVVRLLMKKGFVGVEVRKDLNGKDRMVKAAIK